MADPISLNDRITDALDRHAGPALGLAPGDVELVAFADGIASVRLSAACASCAGGVASLVAGLEQELRRHVPEVEILEAVP